MSFLVSLYGYVTLISKSLVLYFVLQAKIDKILLFSLDEDSSSELFFGSQLATTERTNGIANDTTSNGWDCH